MKIDKEKLSELVAEKSGLEPESVAGQLDELVERIRKTAEKGKALEVKGFGLFYLNEKGDLAFDPSEDFATEVNYKYAGMEPVELRRSGRKEPEQALPADKSEKVTDKPAEETPDKETRDKAKRPGAGRDSGPKKTAASKSAKLEPAAAGKSRRKKSGKKKERDTIMTLVITVITIILLATVLMIVMERPGEEPPQQIVETPAEEPSAPVGTEPVDVPDSDAESARDDEPEPAPGVDPGSEPEDIALQDPEVTERDVEDSFGLHGTAESLDETHYSIILHSMQSRDRAAAAVDELRDEGYRAVLSQTVHEEHGTMWRVGVGQFQSISDALQAVPELPSAYRENHFIGRIQ